MSHEPECPHNDSVCDCQISECSACHCQSIRAAYKRGREDAAKATGAYVITNLDNHLETADFLDGLWNAARGGEQKFDKRGHLSSCIDFGLFGRKTYDCSCGGGEQE